MSGAMQKAMAAAAWRFPLVKALSSRRPVVLMYHGIPRVSLHEEMNGQVFESHILFLKKHFNVISLSESENRRAILNKIDVLLTFDDGFRNNFEVAVPILRRHKVPATFFITSRHVETQSCLWFRYLGMLRRYYKGDRFEFQGYSMDMVLENRRSTINSLRAMLLDLKPHPRSMYEAIEKELPRLEDHMTEFELLDNCAGMTRSQVAEIARDPLFTVGVHTLDHPFLSKCEADESARQIRENKRWLEEVCSTTCDLIAYPIGDYNASVLEQCRSFGLRRGYAVEPTLKRYPELEIPRIGVEKPSLDVLGSKVQWGNLMRWMGIKVG